MPGMKAGSRNPIAVTTLLCAVILAIQAGIEYGMGRLPFCKCGVISLWAGDIWSDQNSQQVADPYSFTHVLHGVLLYGFLWLVARKRLSVASRLVAAVFLESDWEILENSPMIIDRYRSVTVSLGYYGDSILNSLSDVVCMAIGFLLAARLPVKVTVAGAVAIELILLWWIRDNLTLNLIMLIHPLESIKQWQVVH
jgi:hypothetical protein